MEAQFESIEMEVLPTATTVQPPRSQPIDIVNNRSKPVLLPRGPDRTILRERWSISTHRSHSKSTSSSDDDSSSASTKSSHSVIRPFSGDDSDRCVEDFVGDIDSECSRLGWDGSTVLDKAKGLLSGSAAALLVTGNFVSWQGLREILLRQFGHRDTLRHCVRLRGESVAEFRRRIADTAERETIRVLLRGLRPAIARAVEESRPTTLLDAACIAAFYESRGADSEIHLLEGIRGWSTTAEQSPILFI